MIRMGLLAISAAAPFLVGLHTPAFAWASWPNILKPSFLSARCPL